jgi:amino acid adenylation domain-containing protein
MDTAGITPSFGQEALWFLNQLAEGEPRFNQALVFRLVGPLDREGLVRAAAAVVARHPVLRTTFQGRSGPCRPLLDAHAPPTIEVLEPTASFEASPLRAVLDQLLLQPFDLSAAAPLRMRLLPITEEEHILHIVFHPLALDPTSAALLLEELSTRYRAHVLGEVPDLEPAEVDLTAHALMRRRELVGERLEALTAFWRGALEGAPAGNGLPARRPRRLGPGHPGEILTFDLPDETVTALEKLAAQERLPPALVALAAFQVLVARWSDQLDVIVGFPFSGRHHPASERLLGPLENSLPLRLKLDGAPSFREVLRRCAASFAGAEAHQDLPFATLVRELGHSGPADGNPLYQLHFRTEEHDAGKACPDLHDLVVTPLPIHAGYARHHMELTLSLRSGAAPCRIEFDTERFDRELMASFAAQFTTLLQAGTSSPDSPALFLPLEDEATTRARIEAENRTTTDYPRHQSLPELFAAIASEHADRAALADGDGDGTLTYEQLARRAEALARRLIQDGVRPGDFVLIDAGAGSQAVVSMLGTVLAGGAYVPLDPSHPDARLHEVVADSGAHHLVADASLAGRLRIPKIRTLAPTTNEEGLLDDVELPRVGADDPAYMIYTSGSSGRPKGVVVPHRAVVRLVRDTDLVPFRCEDVVAQTTSMCFDVSVFEIWGALLNGARLEMVPPPLRLDPRALVDLLRTRGVSVLFLTSTHFGAVVREVPDALDGLDTFVVGGEVVYPAMVRRALEHGPPRRFLNGYGPTEAGVFSCFAEITRVPESLHDLPIGYPPANNRLYVLDAARRPVPPGVPGELWIGGEGIASGYWRRPELTAARFLPDPFCEEPGARMYRSGDRVFRGGDGAIHFLGRLDDQVKLRGHRIELGEVEARMAEVPGVDEAAARLLGEGDRRTLVGYVTAAGAAGLEAGSVREQLARVLPAILVPSVIMVVDAFPTNSSGKVDRSHLPDAPETSTSKPRTPTDGLESSLARRFAEVLGCETVDPDGDFFDLGGHSLLGVELLSLLERTLGARVSLVTFMRHSSVARLARHLTSSRRAEDEVLVGTQDEAGLLAPLRRVVGKWRGVRARDGALLVGRNPEGAFPPLIWCFQGEAELDALEGVLGPEVPILAMRSGHAILERREELVPALGRFYAQAVFDALPAGPFLLGGNCQGGDVAFEIAWELERRGRRPDRLVLMETVPDSPYPGSVVLLFGRESHTFNPYLSGAPTDELFARNFGRYCVEFLQGGHGEYFRSPNLSVLAGTLRDHLSELASGSQARRWSEGAPPARAARTARRLAALPTLPEEPSSDSLPLPPGDLVRLDLRAHVDQRFLYERSQQLGPVFKAATSESRLIICVVGLARCRRMLGSHGGSLRPDSVDIERMVPKGFLRQMEGGEHRRYRGLMIQAFEATDLASMSPTMTAIAKGGLSSVEREADNRPRAEALLRALDRVATGMLIRFIFGTGPQEAAFGDLMEGFRGLGPDGFVWHPGPQQEAAFRRLRARLESPDLATGDVAGPGVMQQLEALGALDATALGNLVYMVEMGRFDLASLFRWLVKHGAEHPDLLDRIAAEVGEQTAPGGRSLGEAFVLETLRMDQTERLMRVARHDFVFDGFRVPRDSVVRLCLWESHRDPEVFSRPFGFDPTRFVGREYTQDEFAPFGLGSRRCLAAGLVLGLSGVLLRTLASTLRPTIVEDGLPIHGAFHWEPSTRLAVRFQSLAAPDRGQGELGEIGK